MFGSDAQSLMSYGFKGNSSSVIHPLGINRPYLPMDMHRQTMLDYNSRIQCGLRNYGSSLPITGITGSPYTDPYSLYFYRHDPRMRIPHEDPKPSHSYIGLIAMAILSVKDHKLVLSDIYQWILDNYPYFRARGPGWRNSIRHNLSLNDCFVKCGRSANGKGHYWAIHPACSDDFQKGDFRRRRAQRKVRKHMGLEVPDDEDDSPCPSPSTTPPINEISVSDDEADGLKIQNGDSKASPLNESGSCSFNVEMNVNEGVSDDRPKINKPCDKCRPKKRMFDVESLLAPDDPKLCTCTSQIESLESLPEENETNRNSEREPGEVTDSDKNIEQSSEIPATRLGDLKCNLNNLNRSSGFDSNSNVTWSTIGNFMYPVLSVPWPRFSTQRDNNVSSSNIDNAT